MNGAAELETEVEYSEVKLSRLTSGAVARRHGLDAVTVVDNNDDAIDLGLDLIDSTFDEKDTLMTDGAELLWQPTDEAIAESQLTASPASPTTR